MPKAYSYVFVEELTDKHKLYIEKWLKEEYRKFGTGFYCNWNTIIKGIDQKRAYGISVNQRVVAFLIWDDYDFRIRISIAEVKPSDRKAEIGKLLLNQSIEKFRANGCSVVDLECDPPSSNEFWKHNGFMNFPDSDFSRGLERLYQCIVPSLKMSVPQSDDEVIEIWQNEFHRITNENPDWTWIISDKSGKLDLSKPIVQPCHQDWKLVRRTGQQVTFKGKAKQFLGGFAYDGDFIYVKLPIDDRTP